MNAQENANRAQYVRINKQNATKLRENICPNGSYTSGPCIQNEPKSQAQTKEARNHNKQDMRKKYLQQYHRL